ncbi:tyrosine-type recombinase/integrase [Desulfonema magnum]|uniref:Integrase family protein n=1 Tax=Desulfonema magnum TaxID=45655 RepID=A0A975BNK6_9BACT|nr:tyrosine-type recombinase/integrase [Desulfonema magnum]QTA88837.1 Integrase family protein [Desulfonema magnum]
MSWLDTSEGRTLSDSYLKKFAGKSSQKVYRSEIRQFFQFFSGDLSELTAGVFVQYREHLSHRSKNATVKRKFSMLNGFFKFCETQIPGFQSPIGRNYGDLQAFGDSDYAESEAFEHHIDGWKETLICESTKETYSGHVRLFFRWFGKYPKEVTQAVLVAYRDHLLRERKLKHSTVWNRFVAMNGFFKFLAARSRKFKNPMNFKGLKLVPPRKDTGYYSVLSEKQIRAFLDQPDTSEPAGIRDHAMLRLLCTYGLRAGEVCKLRFGDLEPERVGGQQKIWVMDRKGQIGRRENTAIILNGPVLAAVDIWLDWLRHRGVHADALTPIFLPFHHDRKELRIRLNRKRAMEKKPPTVQTVENIVARYADSAGLKTGASRVVSPHALRHSALTMLAREGIKLIDLKYLAGHQDVSTTMIYLHAVQSYDDHVGLHSPVNR